jgi:membrane protease YdiL (CAAX protease family)
MKFSTKPSTTKAAILTAVFFIIWLVTNSNLPACGTEQGNLAQLNGGACVASQSDLHILAGWLALACLITGIVLLILKVKSPPVKPAEERPPQADSHQESFGDWNKGDNL